MLKGVVIDDAQLLNDKLAEWQDRRQTIKKAWPPLAIRPLTWTY